MQLPPELANVTVKPGWVILGYGHSVKKKAGYVRSKLRLLHVPCDTIKTFYTTNVTVKSSYICDKCYSNDPLYRDSIALGRKAREVKAVKTATRKRLALSRNFIVQDLAGKLSYSDDLPDEGAYLRVWLAQPSEGDSLEELVLDQETRAVYKSALEYTKDKAAAEAQKLAKAASAYVPEIVRALPPVPKGFDNTLVAPLDYALYIACLGDLSPAEGAAATAYLEERVFILSDKDPNLTTSSEFRVGGVSYCYLSWYGSDLWKMKPGFENVTNQL
jgi:hypothetical protein